MEHPWLIKNTAAQKGRSVSITPDNTDLEFLSVGRILLESGMEPIAVETDENEISLICLHGNGRIEVDGQTFDVSPFDGVYTPQKCQFKVRTDEKLDLVECIAPVTKKYDPAYVPFSKVKNDPELHQTLGEETFMRELYTIIGTNVEASRLLIGVTFGKEGNWTSWPPHEHAASKEEVYLYFDMPRPNFGIQCVYTDGGDPEAMLPVFEDDAVIIKEGYHQNVGVPSCGINFVWILCGLREGERDWSEVNFQPGF
ncbi:MAG: 5-deoxy-glucuronate isomerase [Gemmatimonadota bacterium]|nr:MAG: 5-deoxy-glucuronate isomerase [Gemmatimonadota bacterium]